MSDGEEIDLVMAMPRRELYAVRGYVTSMELTVLDCLQNETWFALPDVIKADIDAKEVRVAVLIRQDDRYLVDEGGGLLHVANVTSDIAAFGSGLRALRELSRSAGAALLNHEQVGIVMQGYMNDDSLEELRPYFLIIYELTVQPTRKTLTAPENCCWVSSKSLSDIALDPISTIISEELEKNL